ncbi:inositol monophosphatase family protein [Pelagibius marinus]|uniref:inositol monophosphatase family protein n=1 Tax=Pelagibius marinus TaxID=2762760 RepID=UPI0029CA8D01|nr:inositol monophosphatase family protein [Pelagibius marinus]
MSAPTAAELLQAAREITAAAAAEPLHHYRAGFSVEQKADESPVTIADRETEAALRQAIAARFPDHGIFGEEYGSEGLEREFVWVVDPIDGTKSFISGSPLFGMLVAVLKAGKPVAGIIRMPALNECYGGALESGSDRDGTPIACRRGVPPEKAFLCINEANGLMADHPAVFQRLMQFGAYQRLTYDCYPYAQLAGGQIDAVVDYNLQPYDYLPVVPVVEAAGGVITDWEGRPLTLQSDGRVVAAASAEIHEALLRTVAGSLS